VIPPDQLNTIRIAQLEAGEERNGLDGEEAPVDVVAQEEVVGVRRVAPYPEDLDEVVKLSAGLREAAASAS
jgi:hypothetical protein